MTVTKKDFNAYVKLQMSGKTNMLDIPVVTMLTGLKGAKVLFIIENYDKLYDKYLA